MPKNKNKGNQKDKPKPTDTLNTSYNMFRNSANRKLSAYLGKIERGNSQIYEAPFAKGVSMETVLNDWDKVLVSISKDWPTLYDFENDMRKNVGPMSVQKPLDERLEDIEHYYVDVFLPSTPISQRAISKVCAEWSRSRGLLLRSVSRTNEGMKHSTNSGSPDFVKRANVEAATDTYRVFTDTKGITWILDPSHEGFVATAILGWRGQEHGPTAEDVKQRVVWMFPYAVNLQELRVYQPAIEVAQRNHIVPAWESMDAVDKEVTDLFDTKSKDDLVVCTDFSRFDQHFNADMQQCAKAILQSILARGNSDCAWWLDEIFPVKYNIPLVVRKNSSGYLEAYTGSHGMGSGSGGTNFDETLTHRALQHEVAMLNKAELNPHSMCLGDDGILSYPGITVEQVVQAYTTHGQECNTSKQYASTQDCVFLRRWHHANYRINGVCAGVYSTMRALGRLRYLERYMDPEYWGEKLVALRQLSIIENCKWHPLREQFADFCMARDKYRLGLDIPGFMANLRREAIEATANMTDFLGYTKTLQGEGPDGIESWWIVKYLQSKR